MMELSMNRKCPNCFKYTVERDPWYNKDEGTHGIGYYCVSCGHEFRRSKVYE